MNPNPLGTGFGTVENAEMVTYRDGLNKVTDAKNGKTLYHGRRCYYDNDPTKGKL
ncbi:MAG: hypothetical protein CM15mP83_8150 [Flavobacteriaceae bacterium]|nr:MAG: hypothetical protein CM15mP83_8150 [Flavobacteriaceae bacterium]